MRRRLRVTANLWTSILKASKPITFYVAKNVLPEDAECIFVEYIQSEHCMDLWFESSVFQDTDPIDLPIPIFKSEVIF